MTARQIFISASNQRRLEKAFEYFASLPEDSEVLVLAATRGATDDFVRACCRARPGLYGVHRFTVTQLASTLATELMAERGLAPAGDLSAVALAARSIQACREAGQLPYFEPVADTAGLARALASTLNELRLAGVAAQSLVAAGAPGQDLAHLLARYEQELEARSLADLATLFRLAVEVASSSAHRLVGLPTLLLDVPIDSRSKEDLLGAVVRKSPTVFATAIAHDTRTIKALEDLISVNGGGLGRDLPLFAAYQAERIEDLQDCSQPRAGESSLDRVRRCVFSTDAQSQKTLDESVEFFSAAGEGLECVEIARRIQALAGQGAAFDRMAILLRDPDAYLPLVEDALRRAGIPVYCTRGTIRPDPAGRAFLALLDCALERLSASKFAEYLSLGQVPAADQSGAPPQPRGLWTSPEDEVVAPLVPVAGTVASGETGSAGAAAGRGAATTDLNTEVPEASQRDQRKKPAPSLLRERREPSASSVLTSSSSRASEKLNPDATEGTEPTDESQASEASETDESAVVGGTLRTPFGWEQLLIDASVIGGKERWAKRLGGLEAEFRLRLDEVEDGDSTQRAHLERQLARLKNLEQFALPLIDRLASWPAQGRWGEWLTHLRELAESALRSPDSVLSVLSELAPMEEVGPVSLTEVRRVLTERLCFLRREPPQRRYGRVFVGTIPESTGRCFDFVFLPGLAEGIFPRRTSDDPLLLDEHRRQLANLTPPVSNSKSQISNSQGPPAAFCGLITKDDRVAKERLLLREAAGAARSRLCASYPRVDTGQGRSRVPSFYALEILRAAEGTLPPLGELEKRASERTESLLGWPAPRDPAEAIDDAEHDLALLAPLLRKPASEVRGQGRYLILENPCLARSLKARRDRWSKKSWNYADGIVDPGARVKELLAGQRLTARPYSPSALQHFAACPYQFLLYAIHRIQEREDSVAIERLDPLTRGALFHDTQFRLFKQLRDAGLLPIDERNRDQATLLADRVLDAVAAEYQDKLAPAIDRVWRSEVDDLRTDLRGCIRQMTVTHRGWTPEHSEFAFGLPVGPDRDPESHPEEVVILNGVRLRGSIDLVERDPVRDVLRVVDYKTGKAPTAAPVSVGGGDLLQPILYALATEKLRGKKVESGVLFYATQRGNYAEHEIVVSPDSRKRIELVVDTIDAAVGGAFLPANPKPDACATCDYRPVCGPHEEARTKHKPHDRPELEALNNLRCQP